MDESTEVVTTVGELMEALAAFDPSTPLVSNDGYAGLDWKATISRTTAYRDVSDEPAGWPLRYRPRSDVAGMWEPFEAVVLG